MNAQKICFIHCVNDERLYQESLKYIHSLDIPHSYVIETVAVNDANSMAAGYNYAMRQSDAKYKVYLHQDVFIINKNFIHDVLELFISKPQLGMLGVVGAARLPANAVW